MDQYNDNAVKLCLWAVVSFAAACSGELEVEEPVDGAGGTGGGGTGGAGITGNAGITASSSGGSSTGGTSSSSGGNGGTTTATMTATTSSSGSGGSGGTSAASCNDALRNGSETDVDCGGPECPACREGQSCIGDADCDTEVCDDGLCADPDCFDGVLNGDETDVDCGGDDCNACAEGLECQSNDDCEWQHCNDGLCEQEEEVCDCDVSDELQILRCGSDNVQVYSPGPFLVAHDGSVVIFQRCVPISPGMCMTMEVYRWESDAGSELVGSDATAKGLSQDGEILLLQAGDGRALMLISPDGTETIPLDGAGQRLSADGSSFIANLHPFGESQAQRWTLASGLEALPEVADAGRSYARDISADGSVIVGYATTSSAVLPAIWSDDGVRVLDSFVNDALSARALAVSGDGSAVVGLTSKDTEASTAASELLDIFRWTADDGMLAIAPALWSGPWGDGERLMVSEDGSVVAGTLDLESPHAYPGAFRWSETDGLSYLYPGGSSYQSIADSMDAVGNVIVGTLGGTYSGTTFVWEAATGAVELAARLDDRGVPIEGWTFEGSAQVSGDGRVVAGIGLCGGTPAVYRAVLTE